MSDHEDDRRSRSRSRSAASANRRSASVSAERRHDSDHRSASRERTNSRDDKPARGGGGGPAKAGISLLVRNLNKNTSAEDVKELFSQYGEVRDVYTPLDYYTKQSRGFAFVEMIDLDGAEAAIKEVDGRELDGEAQDAARNAQTRSQRVAASPTRTTGSLSLARPFPRSSQPTQPQPPSTKQSPSPISLALSCAPSFAAPA
ncbi:hypothetical protein H310_12777 [Aphanomyces invadans]|uniref:RRM domain-containing protein n=1 Tax=Aphanomyces invadans TaxID=157072 RepID=A0A024TG81_9STRA|nr:hypothetical protein H310_12777 [Aphanomyces invadans]ETV93170.1 hypothetical protein H310_12777 [Aphanomyces invadans]|eukprot:XP_008878192.1 hypothetical protein H310_12777 [Aphanomyces invadans]